MHHGLSCVKRGAGLAFEGSEAPQNKGYSLQMDAEKRNSSK